MVNSDDQNMLVQLHKLRQNFHKSKFIEFWLKPLYTEYASR